MIGWFLNTKIGRWLMIAGAAFLALITLRWIWKREGAREREAELSAKDKANAQEIRDRVDSVRPADSVHDVDPDIFRD